jgi:hypothetical protein
MHTQSAGRTCSRRWPGSSAAAGTAATAGQHCSAPAQSGSPSIAGQSSAGTGNYSGRSCWTPSQRADAAGWRRQMDLRRVERGSGSSRGAGEVRAARTRYAGDTAGASHRAGETVSPSLVRCISESNTNFEPDDELPHPTPPSTQQQQWPRSRHNSRALAANRERRTSVRRVVCDGSS